MYWKWAYASGSLYFFLWLGRLRHIEEGLIMFLHCICNLSDCQGAAVKSISEFGSWVWHEKLIRHFVQPSPYFTGGGMRNLASALPLSHLWVDLVSKQRNISEIQNSYGAPMIGICTAHTLLEQFGPLIFGKLRLIGGPWKRAGKNMFNH